MERTKVEPKVLKLKTQLVRKGHTRELLSETDHTTFRIHCYAPGGGENALHAHMKEDHIFVVMQGTATFSGPDGEIATLAKNSAVVLPKGCYYQFSNSGTDSLVLIRFGGYADKTDYRIDPNGKQIPGRTAEEGFAPPELIENAFFE